MEKVFSPKETKSIPNFCFYEEIDKGTTQYIDFKILKILDQLEKNIQIIYFRLCYKL
jgi:hypothetical protein